MIPSWFDRVPNYFEIQGWKLNFQGQKSTWLLFYIMITAHNMCIYSSYDKYNHKKNEIPCFKYLNQAFLCSFLQFYKFYPINFHFGGIFTQTEKWKYDSTQLIKFWWG